MISDPQVDGKIALLFIGLGSALLSVALGVIVSQPFVGAMTRLRAQYSPLSVTLDGEQTRTGPNVRGIFHALKRTLQLEGWQGLYKGAIVNLITGLISLLPFSGLWIWGVLSGAIPTPGSGPLPRTVSWNLHTRSFASRTAPHSFVDGDGDAKDLTAFLASTFAMTLIVVAFTIPFVVMINRAIVTPYRLPYSIKGAVHALLSKYERKRPLVLYCAPGLAVAVLLSAVSGMLLNILGLFIFGEQTPREHPWRAAAYVVLYTASAAWLVPLSVVIAKTSIQLNLGGVIGYDALVHEDSEGIEIDTNLVAETAVPLIPDMPRASATDEDVVQLRPALPKYYGFVDALQTIKREEGTSALYRGWIWTVLALAIASSSQLVQPAQGGQPPATP